MLISNKGFFSFVSQNEYQFKEYESTFSCEIFVGYGGLTKNDMDAGLTEKKPSVMESQESDLKFCAVLCSKI